MPRGTKYSSNLPGAKDVGRRGTYFTPGKRPVAKSAPQVAASDFDPMQAAGTTYDPVARMRQLEGGFAGSPGRRPGGSGRTGLTSSDARGYSQMLNEQQEYLRLAGLLGGGEPSFRTGPDMASTRTLDTATAQRQPYMFDMPMSAGVSGQAVLEAIAEEAKKRGRK